jgi:hypothetical protein
MPAYRIHRMKENPRQQFRWAPHTIGLTEVKPKDYEAIGTVEAPTPYAGWLELRQSGEPLQVGDILESDAGELCIYKYVGFEQAQWHLTEAKTVLDNAPAEAGQSPAAC